MKIPVPKNDHRKSKAKLSTCQTSEVNADEAFTANLESVTIICSVPDKEYFYEIPLKCVVNSWNNIF